MPARCKYTTGKTDAQLKETAKDIFSRIKAAMLTDKSDVKEITLNVSMVGHGFRPFGDNDPSAYIDLSIEVCGHSFNGIGSCEIIKVAKELGTLAKAAGYEMEDKEHSADHRTTFTFPTTFRTYGKPCKEFKELAKVVERKTGLVLEPTTLYRCRLFGKRSVYDESGRKYYTAFNERECAKLLESVKSFGRKRIKAEVTTYDDIDTDTSSRYETECYGSREVTLVVAHDKKK